MIGLIGTNFRTSPVEIREKLAFTDEESVAFMQHLLGCTPINGMVLISTCNRTELYFHTLEDEPELYETIIAKMLQFKKVDSISRPEHFYHCVGNEAVAHLFKVTAGLDSMVLGEYQILGQVKDFFRLSDNHDCSSPIICRLFHKAFEAGKKIRNLYSIKTVPLSAGSAAVSFVHSQIMNPVDTPVLIIGAGQMAETVILALSQKGYKQIEIYNRTEERAVRLAERYQAKVVSQSQLLTAIGHSGLVFATTAAKHPVLTPDMVTACANQSVIMFDLSVPRNIDPAIADIPGVTLYCIDHLKNQLGDNDNLTINLAQANEMINTIVDEFNSWISSLNLNPVIEMLESRFDQVMNQRLDYLSTRLSEQEYDLVAKNAKYLRDKYLRNIIVSLRELSENGRKPDYVEMMNRMLEYKR
jgi:glutamyl-tRNA reductase